VIKDTSGSTLKGYTLSYTGNMTDSSNGNSNTLNNPNGGPSWVTTDGSLANTAAAADYFFTDNGSNTDFTVIFGNLTPGYSVDLNLWMSRNGASTATGYYSYSLDGGTSFTGFNVLEKDGTPSTANNWDTNTTLTQLYYAESQGNDNGRYMNVSSLTVGAAGSLQVKVDDNSSGNWTGLAAMQLTVVPEPSSFVLLFTAGVGILMTRFRRR
jgi:hypothetical protein